MMQSIPSVLLHFDDGRTRREPATTLDRVFLVDGTTIRRFDRVQRSDHYIETPMVSHASQSPVEVGVCMVRYDRTGRARAGILVGTPAAGAHAGASSPVKTGTPVLLTLAALAFIALLTMTLWRCS